MREAANRSDVPNCRAHANSAHVSLRIVDVGDIVVTPRGHDVVHFKLAWFAYAFVEASRAFAGRTERPESHLSRRYDQASCGLPPEGHDG